MRRRAWPRTSSPGSNNWASTSQSGAAGTTFLNAISLAGSGVQYIVGSETERIPPYASDVLILRYLNGDGLEKDEAAGMKLLEESAKQDYTLAKRRLEELKEKKKK